MNGKPGIMFAGLLIVAILSVGVMTDSRSPVTSLGSGELGIPQETRGPVAQEDIIQGEGALIGIQVHGHWRIEVKDPDGTTVSVSEFENALAPEGARSLARLLGGVAVAGEWRVMPGGSDPPCLNPTDPVNCILTEVDIVTGGNNAFNTLTVTVPEVGEDGDDTVILRGTATAQRDGAVGNVSTWLLRACPDGGSNTPECGTGYMTTSRALDPAIPVQTDQSILITVTISFS
jgi:hypothetical protein